MSRSDATHPENRVIALPESTKLTEETIRQLDHLLAFATPEELRDTLIEVYHMYIIREHEMLPLDFKKMAENLYMLIGFLKIAEVEMNPAPWPLKEGTIACKGNLEEN
jgi:hypothetical protein